MGRNKGQDLVKVSLGIWSNLIRFDFMMMMMILLDFGSDFGLITRVVHTTTSINKACKHNFEVWKDT